VFISEVKEELSKMKSFISIDENTKLLTRTILEMREVMDSWPVSKLEVPPTPPSGGSDFTKLCNQLELILWDINARLEAIKQWCLITDNIEYLSDMQTDVRHLYWLSKAHRKAEKATNDKLPTESSSGNVPKKPKGQFKHIFKGKKGNKTKT